MTRLAQKLDISPVRIKARENHVVDWGVELVVPESRNAIVRKACRKRPGQSNEVEFAAESTSNELFVCGKAEMIFRVDCCDGTSHIGRILSFLP